MTELFLQFNCDPMLESLYFQARKQILKIHTESWKPKLNDHFITELAGKCVGKQILNKNSTELQI